MVEMQMCDQDVIDGSEDLKTTGLEESLTHTRSGVDEDFVVTGFNKDGRTVAIMRRARGARTEKRQFDFIFGGSA